MSMDKEALPSNTISKEAIPEVPRGEFDTGTFGTSKFGTRIGRKTMTKEARPQTAYTKEAI